MRPTCAPHYYRIVPQMAKAEGVKFLRMEGGAAVFEVGSGRYEFRSK